MLHGYRFYLHQIPDTIVCVSYNNPLGSLEYWILNTELDPNVSDAGGAEVFGAVSRYGVLSWFSR